MTPEEFQEKYPLEPPYKRVDAAENKYVRLGILDKQRGWFCVWAYNSSLLPKSNMLSVHNFMADEKLFESCEAMTDDDVAARIYHMFLFVYEERNP